MQFFQFLIGKIFFQARIAFSQVPFFPINLFFNKWKICEIKNNNFKNFENNTNRKIFPSPFYQYWADPFYFKNGRKEYLFFENYNLLSMRGKISCAEIFQGNLTNVTDIDDENISPVIRQSLQHWGYRLTKENFNE